MRRMRLKNHSPLKIANLAKVHRQNHERSPHPKNKQKRCKDSGENNGCVEKYNNR